MAKKERKSFIGGALILTLAGIICKIIGFYHGIGLVNAIGGGEIGEYGSGVFYRTYPLYALLLVVSSSGFPTAISRLIAQRRALDDEAGVHRVFRVSMLLMIIIGAITTLLMIVLGLGLAAVRGNWVGEQLTYLAIAPALFFVSVMSAYRGYFQGQQNMLPTATSQITEQVIKVFPGLLLATLFASFGKGNFEKTGVYGAAGALLGTSLSEVVGMLQIMAQYLWHKVERRKQAEVDRLIRPRYTPQREKRTTGELTPFRVVARQVLAIAIPVTLGASVLPLVMQLDVLTVRSRLLSIGMEDTLVAARQFLLSQLNTFINIPAAFTVSLSMSLVPAISAALKVDKQALARKNVNTALKLALLVGMPSAVGLCLIPEGLFALYKTMTVETRALGIQMLGYYGVAVLFMSVLQTSTGILQGYGKPMWPVFTLGIGGVLKLVVNYVLVGIPSIGVLGAPIGTIVCYLVSSVISLRMVQKLAQTKFQWMEFIVRPAIATAIMGVAIWLYGRLVGGFGLLRHTAIGVLLGVIVYALALVLTGALNRTDFDAIPGGMRLARLLARFHLLREPKEEVS